MVPIRFTKSSSVTKLTVFLVIVVLVLLYFFKNKLFQVYPANGVTSDTITYTTAQSGSEDTYVDATISNTNYGTLNTLKVDASPINRILVRFNITDLPAGSVVTGALLRFYVTNYSAVAGSIYGVNGSWSESTTNYSNAPSLGALVATFSNPATVGTWVEANVTTAVVGNGFVNFYVTSTSSDGAWYNSGEALSNQPTLIVNYLTDDQLTPSPTSTATPTPTPTPVATSTDTATPTSTPIALFDPILIGAGDISRCSSSGDEATATLINSVFATGVSGKVFAAGDNVYESGTQSEFANCYDPSWGQFKSNTSPAVGNHEYLTSNASGYFGYFGSAAGDPAKGYYSYELGSWHVVVLNSNCSKVGGCGVGSPQEKWLRSDLAAHPTSCTAAYWHHAMFSSGSQGPYSQLKPLFQALYDYNADLTIVGHDHVYERFAPQDPSGKLDNSRGIREFIVGTGGSNHTSFKSTMPNSEVRNSDTFGVVKFTLHPDSYDWQFLPIPGKNFTDTGTQNCH